MFQDVGLRDQAAAVASGETTAAALVDATQGRIRAFNETLNAICADGGDQVDTELAVVGNGPLYGVPIGVKDMFSLPWYAPMNGTSVAFPEPGKGVSGVSERLRKAGALGLFVTNMHQLGIGTTGRISAHGPNLNPWDPSRCAGGSSGGSASSVAARMVAAAVGTDAAGSIRIPASYCGITGLKPTFGAVPVEGYTGSYSSMGVIGPMARDADDCRVLGEALLDRPLVTELPSDLTCGIPAGYLWDDVEPAVAAACRDAMNTLVAGGVRVTDVRVPNLEHSALAAIVATGVERLPQLTADWMRDVFPTLAPGIRGIIKSRLGVSANVDRRVTLFRSLLRRQCAELFQSVDVLVWPTVPTTAPALDRPLVDLPSGRVSSDIANLRHVGLANLTGIPAITVPCGVDEAGLPIGLSFHAAWGKEDLLLAIARQFELLSGNMYSDNCPMRATQVEGAK